MSERSEPEVGLRPVSGSAEEVLGLLRGWDAVAAEPEPLVIATSGSTGRPKRVVLSRSAMRASALATLHRLGGPGQWVLNLPPTYVAGVQVLYRSVLAGTAPVLLRGSLADTVERMSGKRRYLSLVPTQLYRLLEERGATEALSRFDAVLVGGAALDARTRGRAEAAGVRVVQTYGMSETCGGCVYDGVPLDGVAVRVDADGLVLVRGPVLFDGYDADPELTAAAFRDGWLVTNDLGRLDVEGRLEVLGRADDVVVSGGVKVPVQAVEQALLGHPAVASALVVGVPDAEWGERVVAAVAAVRASEPPPSLEELRDRVSPRAWAPRAVVAMPAVPLLANGKVDRRRLRELVAAQLTGDAVR